MKEHIPENGFFAKQDDLTGVRMAAISLCNAVPFGEDDEMWPVAISHPFLTSGLYYSKGMEAPGLLSDPEVYKCWQSDFKKAVASRGTVIGVYELVNSAYKLMFLKLIHFYVTRETFSELLADAWVAEENPNNDTNVPVKEVLTWFMVCDKRKLMTDEDYKVYENLPDEITVYRGVMPGHVRDGLSWTMHRKKAEWFRDRWKENFDCPGKLYKAVIGKDDVIAYFNTRDEDEILASPFTMNMKEVK